MLFRDKPHSEQQFELMTKTEFGIHKEKFIGIAHSFCVQLSLYFQRKKWQVSLWVYCNIQSFADDLYIITRETWHDYRFKKSILLV